MKDFMILFSDNRSEDKKEGYDLGAVVSQTLVPPVISFTVTSNLVVAVNDRDVDGDHIIDWADGYDWNRSWYWSPPQLGADDACIGAPYGTITMHGSSEIKKDECKLRIWYNASWPLQVTNSIVTNNGVVVTNWVLPDSNELRLWRHPMSGGFLDGAPWAPISGGHDFIPMFNDKWTWAFFQNLDWTQGGVMGWDCKAYVEAIRSGWAVIRDEEGVPIYFGLKGSVLTIKNKACEARWGLVKLWANGEALKN